MQFKVPQFLEIEDKIFGPFTFRQFIYLAGGGGMCFMVYRLLGLFWGFIPLVILIALTAALTFYRPNNKPFVDMLEASIKYFMQSKLYIWKKEPKTYEQEAAQAFANKKPTSAPEIKMSSGKLRDLAWSLDVLDLNKDRN